MTTRTDTAITSCDDYAPGDLLPEGLRTAHAQTRVSLINDACVVFYHDRTLAFVVDGKSVYLGHEDTLELMKQMHGAWA